MAKYTQYLKRRFTRKSWRYNKRIDVLMLNVEADPIIDKDAMSCFGISAGRLQNILIIWGFLALVWVGVRVTARISHKCLPYPNRMTFSSSAESQFRGGYTDSKGLWHCEPGRSTMTIYEKVHCHIITRRRTAARRHMS